MRSYRVYHCWYIPQVYWTVPPSSSTRLSLCEVHWTDATPVCRLHPCHSCLFVGYLLVCRSYDPPKRATPQLLPSRHFLLAACGLCGMITKNSRNAAILKYDLHVMHAVPEATPKNGIRPRTTHFQNSSRLPIYTSVGQIEP